VPGPRWIDGAPTLLFERLLATDAESGGKPFRVHDREGLRRSIRESLVDLFETRLSYDRATLETRGRTVLDFGVPDFSHRSARNPEDLRVIARDLADAVAWYEPRLGDPDVTVMPDPDDVSGLVARVTGQMRIGRIVESISFSLPVSLSKNTDDAD
jgi:type VI secretion system lysozyme-like protein